MTQNICDGDIFFAGYNRPVLPLGGRAGPPFLLVAARRPS